MDQVARAIFTTQLAARTRAAWASGTLICLTSIRALRASRPASHRRQSRRRRQGTATMRWHATYGSSRSAIIKGGGVLTRSRTRRRICRACLATAVLRWNWVSRRRRHARRWPRARWRRASVVVEVRARRRRLTSSAASVRRTMRRPRASRRSARRLTRPTTGRVAVCDPAAGRRQECRRAKEPDERCKGRECEEGQPQLPDAGNA